MTPKPTPPADLDAAIDALHGPGAAAAIEAAYADGSIFGENTIVVHDDQPITLQPTITGQAFARLAPALAAQTAVMWVCSCGEMWAGPDMERDVHRHGSYEAGTHRIDGPLFRDPTAEQTVRAAWAKEDGRA